MNKIAEIYAFTLHQNLKPLYANWEPGRPIELGDYGLVKDYSLIYLGNIKDLKIAFDVREDTKTDRKSFSSEGATEVKLHGKGRHYVKATLEINFSATDAVFFNAAECKHSMVSDVPALGRSIMGLYRRGKWDQSWAVVTHLVKAGATTVAISGGDSSSLILEASAEHDFIDLASASAKLNLRSEKNVGYQVIAQQGMVPLIGLSKIQSAYLGLKKDFNPLVLSRRGAADSDLLDEDGKPELNPDDKQLFFGQLQ